MIYAKVLLNSRMDFETLNTMILAIKESLPVFYKYYEKKAEILGHKSKLPFYDVYAPITNNNMKLSYMEDKDLIVSSFQSFSESLSCFSKRVFEDKWIDTEPRVGKGNFGLEIDIFPIQESSISNDLYFIVDFYGRYLFENELFERRKSGALSVDELNELMVNCMKKSYGDSIEAETIHPYMWMNKVGYFMAGNEYLNFPYSFGVLFSKGLYAQYIKHEETFVNQYDKFLSETSTNNIYDVAKIIVIDVHSMDFWRSSLKLIEKFINVSSKVSKNY